LATLKAVRHAYELLGKNPRQSSRELEAVGNENKSLYYLV
jgi:hypothetical protein